MNVGRIEALLRSHSQVVDVAIRERQARTGESRQVVYVVSRAPVSVAQIRDWILAAQPELAEGLRVVLVPALPLADDGEVDGAALAAIPVLDDDCIATAEAALAGAAGVARLAAVPVIHPRPARPLHLAELFPGWQRGFGPGGGAGAEAASEAVDLSAPEALVDGGRLRPLADAPRTLQTYLERALGAGGREALTYIDSEGRSSSGSYADLAGRARRVLSGLRRAGLQPGAHLILHLQENRNFLEAFWACVLGGFVPVPVAMAPSYAELNGAVRRLGDAWQMLGGAAPIVCEARWAGEVSAAGRLIETGTDFPVLAVESLADAEPAGDIHPAGPDDIALMMLTSGSTGKPKGVPLAHRNLIARTLGSCEMNGFTPDMVSLNWMPLDHVAGLIFFHLRDTYLACRQVQVPTALVLSSPLLWLDLLDRHRVEVTFAPNFAFGLVCGLEAQIRERKWDLSCVRMILNGGEAIVAAPTRRFLRLLAPHRLGLETMVPAWGMSEVSSGVTYEHDFRLGNTADDDKYVKVGRPIPGVLMRVVDDAGAVLRQGQVGHLQIAGDTVFGGYYGGRTPREEIFTPDGWFRTGDLARIDGDSLSITGREKDVIIINGANYSGPAIEAAVEELAGVDRSFTAACAAPDPRASGEGLALFFVPTVHEERELAALLARIRQCLTSTYGLSPAYLVPLGRNDIPKTSIGKIQRGALQKALLGGGFEARLRLVDVLTGNSNTLPPWFFTRAWHRRQGQPSAGPAGKAVLVAGQAGALFDSLAATLAGQGAQAVLVEPGEAFARVADGRFRMNPRSAADLPRVFAELAAVGLQPRQVVYLWRSEGAAEAAALPDEFDAARACAGLAAFVAGLPRAEEGVRLLVVSNGVANVSGTEGVDSVGATLAPLVHSLAAELPGLDARHLDCGAAAPADAAGHILAELAEAGAEREVAYRDGLRWVPVVAPCADVRLGEASPLVSGGRYLISGGLGGVGTELAAFLLREFAAEVVLVGRTPLPPRDQWDAPGLGEEVRARIAAHRRLADLGAGFTYVAADVADAAALRAAVLPVLGGRGVNALFHLAGAYHERRLVDETEDSLAAVFRAKIGGARVLQRLAAEWGAPCVAFSSATSLFGGALVGAYAAANRFLDSLAAQPQEAVGSRFVSLQWTSWQHTGLSERFGAAEPLRAMGLLELGVPEALRSLQLALSQPGPGLAIGLDQGNAFIARHRAELDVEARVQVFWQGDEAAVLPAASLADAFGTPVELAAARVDSLPVGEDGLLDRAALEIFALHGSGFRPAQNDTEARLVGLWRRVLGIQAVSTEANFFELGGQSLLASQLITAIGEQFGVFWTLRDIFAAPTVVAQAARLAVAGPAAGSGESGAAEAPPPSQPAAPREHEALSWAQQRLWFLDRIHPANAAFNIPAVVRFQGAADEARVRATLQQLVERHAALRTVFPLVDGVPRQRVLPTLALPLEVERLPDGQSFEQLAREEAARPFDLVAGPLFRARLVDGGGSAALLVTMHHIVSDGWSMKVFFREFAALYLSGDPACLPPLTASYADFAVWQREEAAGERVAAQLAFWKRQLAGNLTGFLLPSDFPRPAVQTYAGARHIVTLPPALSRRVRQLARSQGVTLYVALLAAFKALLARYARETDVVVGTVVANRDRQEFEALIGFLVNVVVLRTDLGSDPRFVDVLQRVQHGVLDAYANHEVPFESLVDVLQPERDVSRSPLFQIAFDLRDVEITRSPSPALGFGVMEADVGACQYDLHLTFEEHGEELVGIWQFNTDLFAAPTIARMADNFETLLAGAVARPELRLSGLPLLGAGELDALRRWNASAAPFAAGQALHQLFEAHAARAPGVPAAVFGEASLSYGELDALANRWARYLQQQGVGPGSLVGISLPRSIDLVVAVLAVLKAGGGYLPLDPAYPEERLRFMLDDARLPLLLSHAGLAPRFAGGSARVLAMDALADSVAVLPAEALPTSVGGSDLAYVIYTSGSTGRPKGVQVEHHGWCNVAQAQHDVFGIRPGMRVLQFASLSFDASAFEIAMALGNGATLVLADSDTLMPGPALAGLLARQRVQVVTLPPTALAALPDAALPELEVITVAGEACPAELVARWAQPPRRFFNLYGPTEATIWSSYARCQPGAGLPPIGRPVPNVRLYVTDGDGNLLPAGMPGELSIGGEGVTRGYIGRPELDAERFVPDRFGGQPGGRLYRSGDLVRLNAAGELEFLGRIDHQVKLRGFRIELGEIESLLLAAPEVREALVVAQQLKDGDTALVAYVTPREGATLGVDALRQRLRDALPAYMVPAYMVALERFPLTPNGKVDRAALPDPTVVAQAAVREVPQNELEAQIAAVWEEVLGNAGISRRQNFFDAGGHSMKMARVQLRLAEILGREVDLVDLFRYPTIASLASFLGSGPVAPGRPAAPVAGAPAASPRPAPDGRRIAALAERQRAARKTPNNNTK
ncbi:MAG: amino acid adenylation domain-containing protein [Proteobacteria bacterium]|nr:amino acid adenylation domain-containing protein [Pseudomonadota bacterium]